MQWKSKECLLSLCRMMSHRDLYLFAFPPCPDCPTFIVDKMGQNQIKVETTIMAKSWL